MLKNSETYQISIKQTSIKLITEILHIYILEIYFQQNTFYQ